jgi:carbamoyltransferase
MAGAVDIIDFSMSTQYILGIGLSHNGSAVLLADGKVVVGIEKERLTRKKHDGGNDYETVKYCLEKVGISVNQLSLIVQCANFEKDNILIHQYKGKRYFPPDLKVPVVTISHHLAHAYSAIGSSPFNDGHVFVLDGCGSPFNQCDDIPEVNLNQREMEAIPQQMYCEKDSFYAFQNGNINSLMKDFSEMVDFSTNTFTSTTKHSIGGLYGGVSAYCFGNMDDAGKLMGLAPYGTKGEINLKAFDFNNGRVFVRDGLHEILNSPAQDYHQLKSNFKHYADVACWIQHEVEEAILYTLNHRIKNYHTTHLMYAGGVALNALANTRIKHELGLKQVYIEPAAGDNGLALGCAYYGWIEILKQKKIPADGNTCFGYTYTKQEVLEVSSSYKKQILIHEPEDIIKYTVDCFKQNKTVAWFQGGSEFGPRALGHRSILANPFISNNRNFINEEIKCREDFRPFAPVLLREDVSLYFKNDEDSPYMLWVNQIKPEFRYSLASVVHENHTSRTQTVTDTDHPMMYKLLQACKQQLQHGILLNTSFNKRGMPIVETPKDAIDFFVNSKLDVLVINEFIVNKVPILNQHDDNNKVLEDIVTFLNEIGITTTYANLDEPTFLPGILIHKGSIKVDKSKLLYPGDILHEAGHIAVTPALDRASVSGDIGEQKNHNDAYGDEIAAMLWSYAALNHLQLKPEIVFHPHGYKGSSDMFIENFTSGNYIGLPLLKWMGLCNDKVEAGSKEPVFPTMKKWLRD